MDIRHSRLGGAAEWLVAIAFLIATVTVAALIVREMRAVRMAPSSAPAPPSQAAPPAAPPDQAIKVPSLLLPDGKQVRQGDTLEQVASQIGSSFQMGADVVEEGPLGNRITRFCEHAGTKFVLVLEPYERNGPPRVTAIYLR
jgi:hypothetical protein